MRTFETILIIGALAFAVFWLGAMVLELVTYIS